MKKTLLLHANCQGERLAEILPLSAPFARRWKVEIRLNYLKQPVSADDLERCHCFLYQHLGGQWAELSSHSLLARLPEKTPRLCLPNLFFKGYWPFWVSDSPINFGDRVLDKLIESGAQKSEIMRIYLQRDINVFGNVLETLAHTLAVERQKEAFSGMETTDIIEEFYQQEMLFYTVNHPGKRLLLHVADRVLHALGYPPLEATAKAAYQPAYNDFEHPIHPQVAAALNLAFCPPGRQFHVFNKKMTFAGFVSRYIDCRLDGLEKHFVPYLHLK